MDEKATMGQSLRSTEDEETIDLMELARLLWAHAVQIVAAAVAAALICLLVCMFALTPKYQASINMIDTEAERAGEIAQTIADIVPDVLVEKVEAGSCKAVSDVIIDPNKVFPQTKKYVVLAGLLGAVVVCGVLVLAHLLHDTIVDDEDVQKKLGLPVLGLIPEG